MTESLTPESGEELDQEDTKAKVSRSNGPGYLALLLATASLLGTGWLWWQSAGDSADETVQFTAALALQEQRLEQLESRSGTIESRLSDLASADPGQRLSQLEQGFRAAQSSSGEWKSFREESAALARSMQLAINEGQTRLDGAEARLAALSTRQMDSSSELDQAEVDYLLRLAQERIQLFADTRTADQALELADRHIAAFDNPMYIGVRSELASARQQLSQVEVFDFQTFDQSMDLLQSQVSSLVFKGGTVVAQPKAAADESGWWSRVKSAFSGLVTVRRNSEDENKAPLVADQELIRQRAWLELEVARLAAMRGDQESYISALDRFSSSLDQWFEASDNRTLETRGILDQLKRLNTNPEMPDISAPWAALQAIRASGMSAAPRAEELPEENEQPVDSAETESSPLPPGNDEEDTR